MVIVLVHGARMTRLATVFVLWLPMLAHAEPAKVSSKEGACRISVPDGWTATKSGAQSPDKKLQLTVHLDDEAKTFQDTKNVIKTMGTSGKILKDEAAEFEYVQPPFRAGTPSRLWRAIASGHTFCLATVDFEQNLDKALAMARTLSAK